MPSDLDQRLEAIAQSLIDEEKASSPNVVSRVDAEVAEAMSILAKLKQFIAPTSELAKVTK